MRSGILRSNALLEITGEHIVKATTLPSDSASAIKIAQHTSNALHRMFLGKKVHHLHHRIDKGAVNLSHLAAHENPVDISMKLESILSITMAIFLGDKKEHMPPSPVEKFTRESEESKCSSSDLSFCSN